MMIKYANFALTGVLTLFVLFSTSNAQDPLSVDKEHVAGVIEAHLASLEAWQKGDVLIRRTESGQGRYFRFEDQGDGRGPVKYVEGPDSSSLAVEVHSLTRVVFDYEQQKALVISRYRKQRQVFNALDKESEPTQQNIDSEQLLNDPEVGMMTPMANGGIQTFKNYKSVLQVLSHSGADCRTVGLGVRLPWDKFKVKLTGFANVDSIASISNVGRNIYQLTYLGEGHYEGQIYKYDWDLSRHVPVKFWTGSEQLGTLSEGTTRWQSIDGQHVPVFSRHRDSRADSLDAKRYFVDMEHSIDLHWFSFNEELADDLFDKKILTNREKINEMLNADVFEKQDDAQTREKRN